MPNRPTLLLIDGHSLLHRAYHALPTTLSTQSGEETNAILGFVNMLLKALGDLKPAYVAVAFDRPTPTFRHDQYVDYKANRPSTPDGLRKQIQRTRDVVRAFNMPIYEVDGFEADDVLGTLALQASAEGVDTVIITGDTDALQLVTEHVSVLTPRRGMADTMLYDVVQVKERYGFDPDHLADFKGLKGDTSDNIPGVSGIGDKTAAKLICQFGSVDNMYAHLDEVQPARLRELLAASKDQATLSKYLATIVTDVPVKLDLKAARLEDYNRATVLALFQELEFRNLMSRLPASADGVEAIEEVNRGSTGCHQVTTREELARLTRRMRESESFVFDVETTSLNALQADLVGISVALQPGEAYYIPVGHVNADLTALFNLGPASPLREDQLPLDVVMAELAPLLADSTKQKVAHNAKYDALVLDRHAAPLSGPICDTYIAAHLLQGTTANLGLKEQVRKHLGIDMVPITDLIGKGRNQITMAEVPVDKVTDYACADADMTGRLWQFLAPQLPRQSMSTLFYEVEMPLVEVLTQMELDGVLVDVGFLKDMSRTLYIQIGELEKRIYDEVGHMFNLNSSQQLAKILFGELQLPAGRRTTTGHSTDAEVLEGLRGAHPVIDLILTYRQLTKLKSTYIDALPLLVDRNTGRVHTSYNQAGTTTGRLSSSDPNLQNIPIRTDVGREIRRAFIAPEGSVLLSADYSQIELRVLAHITHDANLVGAFERGDDIHAATAATVYGVPMTGVTSDMRRVAKVVNFGIIYGMGEMSLARDSGLSREKSREFIRTYFEKYPGVRDYIDRIKSEAARDGFVMSLLGRRRALPELLHGRREMQAAAERMAINMPIQGTAADIIKVAMVRLFRRMREERMASKMILQVHDELIFETPEDELPTMRQMVRDIMEHAIELAVPVRVDIGSGKNWLEIE